MSLEFQLFTSLRYDSSLCNVAWNTWPDNPSSNFLFLPYHLERLIQAAEYFGWSSGLETLSTKGDHAQTVAFLRGLCQECVDLHGSQQPLRIRILLSRDGQITSQAFPTVHLTHDLLYASTFNPNSSASFLFPTRQLKVYMDTEPTAKSPYTSYKTTARAHYDAARARASIMTPTTPEEVILYNTDGDVTEGSIRNVAFWREDRWVTPRLDTGCLAGTVRRWLIEQGRVVEGTIRRDQVSLGEWVILCNGVEGCLLGIVSSR